MPTPTSTNRLMDGVMQQLQDVLPGLVATAGLDPIKEFLDYDPPVPIPNKAPQVWVDLPQDRRSGDGERGATLKKYSHEPTFLVSVTSAGHDASAAVRKLRGYVDLIRQCLEGNQTLDGNTLWVRWVATDYSPNMGRDGHLFKEAMLTFDLNRRTTIGED